MGLKFLNIYICFEKTIVVFYINSENIKFIEDILVVLIEWFECYVILLNLVKVKEEMVDEVIV